MPTIVTDQNGQLGGNESDDHDDDERDRGEPREEPDDDEGPADDLDHAHKRPHEVGKGDADSGEAAGAKNVGKDELLDSFRKEDDEADEEPDEDRPS